MNKKERKAKESRIIRKIEGIIIDEGFTRKIHTYSHFRKDYAAFIKLAERTDQEGKLSSAAVMQGLEVVLDAFYKNLRTAKAENPKDPLIKKAMAYLGKAYPNVLNYLNRDGNN